MMIKHFSISAVALAVVLPATSVQADDWSGAYFNISGGYTFSNVEAGSIDSSSAVGPFKNRDFLIDIFSSLSPEGGQAQAFLGYRMQTGDIVYSAEIGVASGDMADDEPFGASIEFGESYFVRGTVGTEWQGALVFGSLGVVSTANDAGSGISTDIADDRAMGLSIGSGHERMLTDHWALRTEINHTVYSDDYNFRITSSPQFTNLGVEPNHDSRRRDVSLLNS